MSETLQAIGTEIGLINSGVSSASYTISTCAQNLAIGNFALCGESYNDVSTGTNVDSQLQPVSEQRYYCLGYVVFQLLMQQLQSPE